MNDLRFPDRAAWARSRRTVYADDLDKVTDQVSSDPADYATSAEITQATAELGDLWRQLGHDLRAANQAAKAVFPSHGSRFRKRNMALIFANARDALAQADKAVVEHAEELKHHRQLVNAAADQLVGADGCPRLERWTVNNADKRMSAHACPTWRAIVTRWKAALGEAGDVYVEQVKQRPVDDQAWRRELDRRAEIELARARGHLAGDL